MILDHQERRNHAQSRAFVAIPLQKIYGSDPRVIHARTNARHVSGPAVAASN